MTKASDRHAHHDPEDLGDLGDLDEAAGPALDRRALLKAGAALAAGLAGGAVPAMATAAQAAPAAPPEAAAVTTSAQAAEAFAEREGFLTLGLVAESSPFDGVESFKPIPELTSRDGRLDVDLTVRLERHEIATRQKTYQLEVRSYVAKGVAERGMWAPTLRLKPDDRLTITVHNRLPFEPHRGPVPCNNQPGHGDHNYPHGFNVTNLHTHGLHVSPYEDDVLREVPPSFSSRYSYELERHPPGTHWYHPHVHGATAIQVVNGMTGALIVEPEQPEFPGVAEKVFVLNQYAFVEQGEPPYRLDTFDQLWNLPRPLPSPLGTTINGQVEPVIQMTAGRVERWRFVNAGFRDAIRFIVQHQDRPDLILGMRQIAADGIFLPAVRPTQDLAMGPGNRVDVFVRFDTPGVYHLRPQRYDPEYEYDLGEQRPIDAAVKDSLARIEVRPAGGTQPFPESLPDSGYRIPAAPVRTRDLRFTIEPVPGERPECPGYWRSRWGINGERFDAKKIPVEPKVGTVEAWNLTADQIGGNRIIHPFHIHVNPFLVTEINGKRLRTPMWKDSVTVPSAPPANAGVKVLTHYRKFTGDFVLHCHILAHEDVGMMQRVRIVE